MAAFGRWTNTTKHQSQDSNLALWLAIGCPSVWDSCKADVAGSIPAVGSAHAMWQRVCWPPMGASRTVAVGALLCAVAVAASPARAVQPATSPLGVDPFVQQGERLTGEGGAGTGAFGASVALSADGTTAIVGAPYAHGSAGAAWVFIRSGSTWTQGPQLTGGEETGEGGASPPRSHSRQMATARRSSEDPTTAQTRVRCGCSRAQARRGPSRAPSSPAPVNRGSPSSARAWRSPATGRRR